MKQLRNRIFSLLALTLAAGYLALSLAAGPSQLTMVPNGISLKDLVGGLNSLGVGPRDMMSILQAIKAAGALQAEIQVL